MDLSTLPRAGALVRGASAERWRPGLASPLHSEVFAAGNEGCGAAAALALALDAPGVAEDARAVLHERGLDHATVQIECPSGNSDCADTF